MKAESLPPMPNIASFGADSLAGALASRDVFGNAAWPANNQAFYIPFKIEQPFTATLIQTITGGGATGNIDVGIYDEWGVRLVSTGGAALSSAFTQQSHNITDTLLLPGMYYMAIALSSTSGSQCRATPSGEMCRAMGVYTEASAYPLPAVATFAATTYAYLPHMVICSRSFI